jgi:multimeric flavodoxin WrbA
MGKRIIAVNAGPRKGWNTDTLISEAVRGAEQEGAEVVRYDLYKLERFTGCISCFGCKLPPNEGKCVCRDGLSPVLQAIREADGLIIGTPNYLGDATAGFRALYERLVFQALTYKKEPRSYNTRSIPVLLIMTSNAAKEYYPVLGYRRTLNEYQKTLGAFVGDTKLLIVGDTMQVDDYSRFDWTMFNGEAKTARHNKVFPGEMKKAFSLGAEMVKDPR